MSISTELTTLSTNITNAYNAIQTKGGTIPTNKNTENLATAINSISTGGSSSYEEDLINIISNRSVMTSINFPEGITSIGNYAFNGCTNLALTSLPNGITSIGNSVFYNCSSLTSLRIGSNIQTIDSNAFSGCTKLTTIYINLPRATVEAMSGYGGKWGATNATIICNDDAGWVEA